MELVVLVKRDCETCCMVAPVLADLKQRAKLTLYSQDDPAFPEEAGGANDDTSLEQSWKLGVEIVPTVIRMENGREIARTEGWNRDEWARVTGLADLGPGLPPSRPGCGSKSVGPGMPERLGIRFGAIKFASRAIPVDEYEDPIEVAYDRGWSDAQVGGRHHAARRRGARPDPAEPRALHGGEGGGQRGHGGLPAGLLPRRAGDHRSRAAA